MSNQRAKAHAKRCYYCSCGARVHGNGGRAMHFAPRGERREGHRELSQEQWIKQTYTGAGWEEERKAQWDKIHGAKS